MTSKLMAKALDENVDERVVSNVEIDFEAPEQQVIELSMVKCGAKMIVND